MTAAKAVEAEPEEQETQLAKLGEDSENSAIVANNQPTRGSGRGLKAVQSSKELSKKQNKVDGSETEAKQKIKEQKLYKAKTNEHVETKVVTEDNRKTTKKDGSTVVTS